MPLLRTVIAARAGWKRMLPLMRDGRVPTALKAGTVVAALLIISPLDIFGDVPVLGLLDDAVLLTLLCMLFVWLAAKFVANDGAFAPKNVTPRAVPGSSIMRR